LLPFMQQMMWKPKVFLFKAVPFHKKTAPGRL